MTKKILLLVLIASISLCAHAQTSTKDSFGFWGYQPVTTGNFNLFRGYNVKGLHEVFLWKDVRPKIDSAYNWTSLNNTLDTAIKANVFISFQGSVGQNSPQWVFDSCGSFITIGNPQQPGPYPKYYNPKYKKYYYQFLRDFGNYLASLSPARRGRVLAWQIAEGSTGDEQPYKGVLDTTAGNPNLSDPFIPQNRFDTGWESFRRAAWDTAAYCSGYIAVSNYIALMINSGNDGSNIEYAVDTSSQQDINDNSYIAKHFTFLPLPVWGKEGQMSHVYAFKGEQSYLERDVPISRGEIQGWITRTTHAHRDYFTLMCSALTGELKIINGDQTYPVIAAGDTRMSDFFTLLTNSKADAFSMPAFKVDWGDTVTYPTAQYGDLIDPLEAKQFKSNLYNNNLQVQGSNNDPAQAEWLYWKAVARHVNPARVTSIDALFPQASFGNQQDSIYYNDHVVNTQYDYHKNMFRLNPSKDVKPVFRVGPDTSLYGRFAGQPILSNNKCTWYYDVENKLIQQPTGDSVQITITYLQNGSGGSIGISCLRCGTKVTYGSLTTITTNNNLWATKTVIIPNFIWKNNGYDFMLDFTGGPTTTIGFIQVKNLSKK